MALGALVGCGCGDDARPASGPPATRGAALLRWPMPALACWTVGWAAFLTLRAAGSAPLAAFALAAGLAAAPAWFGSTPWRRGLMAAGFPASLSISGVAGSAGALPGWAWLLPLALLALAYPRGAWRDAPWFPTPAGALAGLAQSAPLSRGARVLDAGCGLGQGLEALAAAYPEARIDGIEWSLPIAWLARARCRFAQVRQGDMWRADWRPYACVYLFQRPESMARAVAKARAEMAPGTWLASLEFEARELQPQAVLHGADGRPVWLYRLPFVTSPTHQSIASRFDADVIDPRPRT